MKIRMAGVEHSRAALEYREIFAFTKAGGAAGIEELRSRYPGAYVVLLATCNRTELWVHSEEELPETPFEMLCALKGVEPEAFGEMAIELSGQEAVRHLLRLACGMESRIFGEDQIITQVKEALAIARERQTADCALDRLFQTAVTAAKRVKSEVRLSGGNTSVMERALKVIREEWPSIEGKRCLVIGNGEMGRLAAMRLLEEGCQVCMTIRQYRHGDVAIPFGCRVVPYDGRMGELRQADIVVSATASPHHTLHFEQAAPEFSDGRERFLIDLAVPRDISARLGMLQGIRLYDIDSLGASGSTLREEQIQAAEAILDQYGEEFARWYHFRDWVPVVDAIGRRTALDVGGRLRKPVKQLGLEDARKEALEEAIRTASFKSVTRLLYALRENLDPDKWKSCLEALEQATLEE